MSSVTSTLTNNFEESYYEHQQQQQISSYFDSTTQQQHQTTIDGSSYPQTNGNQQQMHQSCNEIDTNNVSIGTVFYESISVLNDFSSHEEGSVIQQQMDSNTNMSINTPLQQINTPSNNDVLFPTLVQSSLENMLTADQTNISDDKVLYMNQHEIVNVPAGQQEQKFNAQLPATTGDTGVASFYTAETSYQCAAQELPQLSLDDVLEYLQNLNDNEHVQINNQYGAQELPNVGLRRNSTGPSNNENVNNRRARTIRNRRPSTNGQVPAQTITLSNGRIKCIPCNKDFTNNAYATQHNKKHHSGDLPHRCDHCGKRFLKKEKMEAHRTTHDMANKPFKCQYCDKRYARKSDMQRHFNTQHDSIKNFQCNVCKKCFDRNDHLLKHKHTHYKNNKIPKKNSPKQ